MSRSELIASRARIVTTADETRRRIERDLHDGTQQQLVGIGFDLQGLKPLLPENLSKPLSEIDRIRDRLLAVIDEVREISRGLHPALLSQAGLGPALNGLARRSPIPTHVDLAIDGRLPESIEIAAYYAVSEALANAAKHANASEVRVAVQADDVLRVVIFDNGQGGAQVGDGSGLVGLIDRVEALGATFRSRARATAGRRSRSSYHSWSRCIASDRAGQHANLGGTHLDDGVLRLVANMEAFSAPEPRPFVDAPRVSHVESRRSGALANALRARRKSPVLDIDRLWGNVGIRWPRLRCDAAERQ
jgi:Histidine kinase